MAANLSPGKGGLESSEPENWFTAIKPPHTRAFAEQDYDLVSERNSILFFCPDYTASPHQSFGLKDRSLPSLTLRQGMADPISSHISQIYKSECQHENRDVLLDLCQSCREQDGSRTCQKLHLDPSIPFRQPSPNPQRSLSLKPCSVVLPKLRIGLNNNPVAKPPRDGYVQIEIQTSDSEHGNETDMHGNGTGRHGNGTNRHWNETSKHGNETDRCGNEVGRHENETNQNENRELKSDAFDADENESLDLFSNEPETNEPIIDETKQNENETIQIENEIRRNETRWSDDDDSGLPDTFPCVSCQKHINWKEERVHTHKILNVLTCLHCFQTFNTGVFEVDEEGSEIYCTLCGDGGELFVCDNDCPKSFCQTCILNVCGSEAVEKLKSPDSNWICFVCDPSPLKKDTDFCKHVVETLRSRKKKRRQLERRLKIEKSEKNKVYKSKEFISDSDESEHECMDIGGKNSLSCGTGRKNENQSGENENQSGGNENQSGGNENQSRENENQSGENENKSGENENQSGENENKSGENENQSGENENRSGNSEDETVKNGNESEENEIEETDVHIKEEPPVSTDNDGFYMESKDDLDPVEDRLSSSDSDSNECNLNIPFLFNYTDSVIDDTGEGSGIIKKVRRGSGKPIVKKRKLSLSMKKKKPGVKSKADPRDSSFILSDDDYLLDSPISENPSGETQSKKPADKGLAPSTKTDSPSVDKTKKPRDEFKVKKSDYGIESSKRRKALSSSSSSGSEKEEKKDEVKSLPDSSNVVVIGSSNDEAGDPTPSNLSRNRSRQSRLSSLSSSESKTLRKAKSGDKKVRSKKRIEDVSSSDDGDDNNAFVVPCSLSSSSSSPSPLVKDKDRTVLTIDSDGSSDSLGSKVVRKKKKRKLYFSDEESSSSSSKRRRKVVVLDSSNEEFEDSEGSGYYFKGKHKKRKSLHARISSSDDSDDDDDDDEVGGVRRKETTPTNKSSNEEEASTSTTPVKTKKIRKLISKDKLAFETKEAQKAEKERLERLKKRNNAQTVQDERLILEKDAETSEVLLEVRSSLVSHILPHQAKGIKFLYNCVCEDLKRLQSEPGSGAILAHCMGLGKTFQVISFIDCLLSNSESTNIERVIVLCPVNTLLNWNDEWNKWISLSRRDYRVTVVDARLNNQRLMIIERWFKCGGVALMGYEMFRNLASGSKIRKAKLRDSFAKYLLDPGPDIIICDEGHVLRRESSNLSLIVSRVATKRRIVLTGTPLQNNLKEYYTMVNFVKPNLLGTMREFCNQFANPIANGQCADSSPYQVRVMKYRAHVLFQTLSGCVDRKDYRILAESLPPKYEYVVSIRMTPVQSELISRYLGRNFHTASDLFSTFASLAKVWSHPWVLMLDQERKRLKDGTDSIDGFINDNEEDFDDGSSLEGFIVDSDNSDGEYKVKKKNPSTSSSSRETSKAPSKDCPTPPVVSKESTPSSWFEDLLSDEAEDDIDSSGKILFLLELLEETKKVHEKVLVFSQSLLLLDQIEYLLQQRDFMEGIDYFRLDGSTKASHRTELMKKFNRKNNESIRLFLISTKAGSLGVNLIGANRVVVFDACWNPTHDLQSVFRTYRFGQTKPVFVYRLLAQGTMEEKIYDRQVTKTSLSLRVIDEKQVGRHYTNNQLQELFTFTPAPPPEEDGAYDRPTNDIVFCKILDKLQPKVVIKYHEHDTLLEHIFDEELSEEERKAAWDNYNAAKELESRAYNIGMHVQNDGSFVAPLNNLSGQNPAIPVTDLAKAAFQRVTQGLTISAHIMNAINLRNLLAPKVQNPKDFATIQRYVMTCDKIQIHLQSLQSLIPEIRDNLSNNALRLQLPSNERSLLDSQRMAFLAKLKDIDEAVQVPSPDHNHLRRLLPMFVGQLHSKQ